MPSLYRKVGALSLPLSDTNATDFTSLDPARDILLDLLATAINDELSPRWPDVAANSRLTSETAVLTKVPVEPDTEALQQASFPFPALFVYRDSTPIREEEFTLRQRKYTGRWGVDYFLGPLDVGERSKLADVLVAVGKIIGLVIRNGGHKAYATTAQAGGATSARKVLGSAGCRFSSVQLIEFQAGAASLTPSSPKYWACSATLETVELDDFVAGQYVNPFNGATATLGTGDADGIITDLLVVNTDRAPGGYSTGFSSGFRRRATSFSIY